MDNKNKAALMKWLAAGSVAATVLIGAILWIPGAYEIITMTLLMGLVVVVLMAALGLVDETTLMGMQALSKMSKKDIKEAVN